MDANAQLREHLTTEERAALRELLDERGGHNVAGPAAAGATALAGVGTAAADPSTTDADGDVGLPGDRTDVWADGVDAAVVENGGRYNDGVNVVSLTATEQDDTFTVGPGEFEAASATAIELNANGWDTSTVLEFPSSIPADGHVLRIYFETSNVVGNTVELSADDSGASIEWDGSASIFTIGPDPSTVLVTTRTYDGGATWYGSLQFDDDWREL